MAETVSKEEAIFHAALALDAAEQRSAYLDVACANQPELRRRVEVLLRRCTEAQGPLDRPVPSPVVTTDEPLAERPGTVIGPYKLLEPIGEGGFGVVYMAEQQQPLRRKVALKVLKPGMDSKQVVARFEAERQALALMDHPNIARVLDAGTTDAGLPFFVMELVRGIPITAFCDNNRLATADRLRLFVTVCQAVQHAHTKGIIHRDLKPSNVLVTLHDGVPVVKVIDFGIAKALGQQLTDKTLFTGFAQMVGTPLYMSPEQAEMSGLDVDTRSDVYTLGVLLYELLTGTTPLDRERVGRLSYDELRRVIREEEPPRPSTRISTLGQAATTLSDNRRSDPRRLCQLFRRELDWVVMKALEKDRNRRYESASSFAADVQRFLSDEPVQACPPSLLYRARKFARRNKGAMVLASTILAALLLVVVGLALSTLFVWQAKQGVQQALDRERQTLDRERKNGYFQRVALADRELSANNLSRAVELLEQCPEKMRGWEWHYLQRLVRGKGQTTLKHPDGVFCADFSLDGQWLASSCLDGTIHVWEAGTGRERLPPIHAHKALAQGVAFSPDGQRLASFCWGKPTEVKVWDWQNGSELFHLEGLRRNVNCLAFSPDGRWLVTAAEESEHTGEVRVWDAVTGQHLRTFSDLAGHPADLAFSPDGRRLALMSFHGAVVTVWDVETWKPLPFSWRGQRKEGGCVAFSHDSRLLAAASGEIGLPGHSGVTIWDTQTGEELRKLGGHVDGVAAVAFSPDGQRLVTGGYDQNIKVWDVESGQEVLTLTGHLEMIRRVVFSRDGHQLASACGDGTVRIWDGRPLGDSEPGQELRTLRGHKGGVNSVAYHPDGRLVSAGTDGTIHLWDSRNGRPLCDLPVDAGQVFGVGFSPGGQWLATVSEDQFVRVWAIVPGQATVASTPTFKMHVEGDELFTLAFSPDGRHLAVPGDDYVMLVWNLDTGKPEKKLVDHNVAIIGLAFSPDGRTLASAGSEGIVRLWDWQREKEIIAEPRLRHAGRATCVVFRDDGRVLASGGYDRKVRLWERDGEGPTWKPLPSLTDPTGAVESVAFNRKGDRLAWGSRDGTVKVWEADSGEVHTLRGHLSVVRSVAFSPDDKTLASGSQDGTVKIWRVPGR